MWTRCDTRLTQGGDELDLLRRLQWRRADSGSPGGRSPPGRVDVRGKAGASRAIQAALRAAADRSPAALAAVLAAVIAEGDPWRDLHPLFDLPAHPDGASVPAVVAFPGAGAPGGVLVQAGRRGPVESFPLFGG